MSPLSSLFVVVVLYVLGVEGTFNLQLLSGDAVCIDGSPAGYYFQQGAEADSYLIFLNGGGVCETPHDCYARSLTSLGSSKNWPKTAGIGGGILDQTKANPFSTWNTAVVQYCDGGRYSSNAKDPYPFNKTNLYFRGVPIVNGVVNDLLKNKGMANAKRVILTGCSAGGEGTYYLLDLVREWIPAHIDVKGMADAGWFLDTLDVYGKASSYFAELPGAFTLWGSNNTLKPQCLEAFQKTGDQWRCLFAEYFFQYMTTPIFILQSQIDSYQLSVLYTLPCAGNLASCNQTELQQLYKFANKFETSLVHAMSSPKTGMFVDACPTHCQSQSDGSWNGTLINGHTAASAFASWYFNGTSVKQVDTCTSYPCNKSCK